MADCFFNRRIPAIPLSVLIVLLFSFSSAYCQETLSFEEMDSTALFYRAAQEYDKAISICRNFISNLDETSPSSDYHRKDAESKIETIKFIKQLPEDEKEKIAECDRKRIGMYSLLMKEDYQGSVGILEEIIPTMERILGRNHPEVGEMYQYMAVFLEWSGSREFDRIENLYRESIKIARSNFGDNHLMVSSGLLNLAEFIEKVRGDYSRAIHLYRKMLAIDRKILSPDDPDLATGLLNFGSLLHVSGKYYEAERLLEEALDCRENIYQNSENKDTLMQAYHNLAALKTDMGKLQEADSLFNKAIEYYRNKDLSNKLLGSILSGYSILKLEKGELGESEELIRESIGIEITEKGDSSEVLAPRFSNLANILLRQKRYEEALKYAFSALEIDKIYINEDHIYISRDYADIGRIYLHMDNLEEAEHYLNKAAATYEIARSRSGEAGISRANISSRYSPYYWMALTMMRKGNYTEAWESVENNQGRVLREILSTDINEYLSDEEKSRKRELYNSLDRLYALKNELLKQKDNNINRLENVEADIAETRESLLSYIRELQSRHEMMELARSDLNEVQKILNGRSVLVGWLNVEGDDYMYIVRSEGPVLWEKIDYPDLTEKIEKYRSLISYPGMPAKECEPDSRIIGKAVFGNSWEMLSDYDHLFIVPSGSMVGIPVESIIYNGSDYVIDSWTVSYTPNATILAELTRNADKVSKGSILAIGDPVFGKSSSKKTGNQKEDISVGDLALHTLGNVMKNFFRGGEGIEDISDFKSLPQTGKEVRTVSGYFELSDTLLQDAASERNLKNIVASGKLPGYQVIHIASHAIIDPVNPSNSSIILSQTDLDNPLDKALEGERIIDGRITVDEILREWELNSDLVTLSCCATGLGMKAEGEGYIGFTHAFIRAGTKSILVSLWPVEDKASRYLMGRFYENYMRRGLSKAESLAEAKNWLRKEKPRYQSPYFWSGFVLMGVAD